MNIKIRRNCYISLELYAVFICNDNLLLLFRAVLTISVKEDIFYIVYFLSQCAENHGMFARQTQLILLDDAGNRTEPVSPSGSNPTTPDDSVARARSRLSR